MDNYRPNSHKSKSEERVEKEKKVEPVIKTAKQKKKGEFRKFTDVFISEDIDSVKSYILADVLVPAIKDAMYDVVTTSVKMMLFGEKGKAPNKSNGSKVSYSRYYNDDRRRENASNSSRGNFDYDDIIFETRGDADAVLEGMFDILEQYDIVTVADLYDLANITNKNYMINKYGWSNLSNASVVRVRDGYKLKLQKAKPVS